MEKVLDIYENVEEVINFFDAFDFDNHRYTYILLPNQYNAMSSIYLPLRNIKRDTVIICQTLFKLNDVCSSIVRNLNGVVETRHHDYASFLYNGFNITVVTQINIPNIDNLVNLKKSLNWIVASNETEAGKSFSRTAYPSIEDYIQQNNIYNSICFYGVFNHGFNSSDKEFYVRAYYNGEVIKIKDHINPMDSIALRENTLLKKLLLTLDFDIEEIKFIIQREKG